MTHSFVENVDLLYLICKLFSYYQNILVLLVVKKNYSAEKIKKPKKSKKFVELNNRNQHQILCREC